jgi:hypothetical protein
LSETTELDSLERKKMETTVRKKLEEEFGVRLPERRLAVVEGVLHRFDLASDDASIIGEIKTSGEKVTNFKPTRLRAIWGDFSRVLLLLLARKDAKKRIFAVTNDLIYREFQKSQQGKAAESLGVEIRHIRV